MLAVLTTAVGVVQAGGQSPDQRQSPGQQSPDRSAAAAAIRQLIDLALAHNRPLEAARLALDAAGLDEQATRATYWFAGLRAGNAADYDRGVFSGAMLSGTTLATTAERRLFSGALVGATHAIDLHSGGSATSSGNQRLDLSIRQPILRGAGSTVTNAPSQISRNNLGTSRAQLLQATIDLVGAVEAGYLNLVLHTQALNIQTAAVERAQRLKTTTESLIAAGRLAKSELAQADADVAAQQVSLLNAEDAVRSAENELVDVLDTDLPPGLPLTIPDDLSIEPADQPASLQTALDNRPDWRAARLALDSSDLSVAVARSTQKYGLDFTTNFRAGAAATGLASSFSSLTAQGSTVGLQLDLPINNVANTNAYRTALLARRQQQLVNDELRQQIDLRIDRSVRNVNLQIRQLDLTKRARELAEQALRVEIEKLRVGRSTGVNVVQLQTALTEAQLDELTAKVAYLLARSTLDRETATTLSRWNLPRP